MTSSTSFERGAPCSRTVRQNPVSRTVRGDLVSRTGREEPVSRMEAKGLPMGQGYKGVWYWRRAIRAGDKGCKTLR